MIVSLINSVARNLPLEFGEECDAVEDNCDLKFVKNAWVPLWWSHSEPVHSLQLFPLHYIKTTSKPETNDVIIHF